MINKSVDFLIKSYWIIFTLQRRKFIQWERSNIYFELRVILQTICSDKSNIGIVLESFESSPQVCKHYSYNQIRQTSTYLSELAYKNKLVKSARQLPNL